MRGGPAHHAQTILAVRGVGQRSRRSTTASLRTGCGTRSSALKLLDLAQGGVAPEQLVAAIAAQRHLHVPRRELGNDDTWELPRNRRMARRNGAPTSRPDPHESGRTMISWWSVLYCFGHHAAAYCSSLYVALLESDGKCLHRLERLQRHRRHHQSWNRCRRSETRPAARRRSCACAPIRRTSRALVRTRLRLRADPRGFSVRNAGSCQ